METYYRVGISLGHGVKLVERAWDVGAGQSHVAPALLQSIEDLFHQLVSFIARYCVLEKALCVTVAYHLGSKALGTKH